MEGKRKGSAAAASGKAQKRAKKDVSAGQGAPSTQMLTARAPNHEDGGESVFCASGVAFEPGDVSGASGGVGVGSRLAGSGSGSGGYDGFGGDDLGEDGVVVGDPFEGMAEPDGVVLDGNMSDEYSSSSPWNPQEWIGFFFNLGKGHVLASQIEAFVRETMALDGLIASEGVAEWLRGDGSGWASHCPSLDEIWERYSAEFAGTCNCDIGDLVKPSGPLHAILCIVWHYPTFNTSKAKFGMTFDPTNGCLSKQKGKLGQTGSVLTLDSYPRRMKAPKPRGNPFVVMSYWKELHEMSRKFLAEVSKHSRIRIILGEDNWVDFLQDITKSSDVTYTKIPISEYGKEAFELYGRPYSMYVARGKLDRKIRQLVFASWHLERFFYPMCVEAAKIHDTIWNICAAIAGLDTVQSDYFEHSVVKKSLSISRWNGKNGDLVGVVVAMVGWEKRHNQVMDEGVVRHIFGSWLRENEQLLEGRAGSLAKRIHLVLSSRGADTNRKRGFPELIAANDRRKAEGYPTLVKGTQTARANKMARTAGQWEAIKASETLDTWKRGMNDEALPKAERKAFKTCVTKYESFEVPDPDLHKRSVALRQWKREKKLTFWSEETPEGLRWEGCDGELQEDEVPDAL
ncbi:hypothetical protein IFR04_011742 [Cadophora malorum]|uniref:Uncharacterized protein n=1 Tax=Cadophora malorum TaxID=108018 RepID=A0A8H7W2U6_9HELO|nr:hypothetical protein IFR04_011742 [Cadophora malorum]